MSFLKAEWRKLLMVNYEIEPSILTPYIPYKTELDLWEGKCYVSVVGFMFLNTQLLGVRIPFHTNFEEVNLRFYVKRWDGEKWKRGVVFIKEIVPKFALSFVANTVYKENYETLPMKHEWKETEETRRVSYQWKKAGQWHSIEVEADKQAIDILPNSEIEFISEHYWGYAKVNEAKTNEYEVTHPKWQHYPVHKYVVNVDFGEMYGANFAFLKATKPKSVLLAEGSEITVEPKRSINGKKEVLAKTETQ